MGLVDDCWVTPRGQRLDRHDRGDVRGRAMGNRHYGERWIVCDPAWPKGDARDRAYDVLFFLDEATAFAAGHRPCWTCRNAASRAFLDRWPGALPAKRRMDALDLGLAAERSRASRGEAALVAAVAEGVAVAELPTGAFVEVAGAPHVVDGSVLRRWTPTGYTTTVPTAEVGEAVLLTPPSTVEVLRAGYPLGPLGPADGIV